jgi:hypothetical protein
MVPLAHPAYRLLVEDTITVGVGAVFGAASVKVLATLTIPHLVTDAAVRAPPENPLLNCNTILELSEFELYITVFAGLVHLYVFAGACETDKLDITTLYVIVSPAQPT